MEDIGKHPDHGRVDPPDREWVYQNEDGRYVCPWCKHDYWDQLENEYPFLWTCDSSDLDVYQTTFKCACGRRVTVVPIVDLTFELEVIG